MPTKRIILMIMMMILLSVYFVKMVASFDTRIIERTVVENIEEILLDGTSNERIYLTVVVDGTDYIVPIQLDVDLVVIQDPEAEGVALIKKTVETVEKAEKWFLYWSTPYFQEEYRLTIPAPTT